MKIDDIAAAVERIAPLRLAQGWDNVGLLVGDPGKEVVRILLTIDTTRAVVEEAKRLKADLILSYHPVIWDGLKRVVSEGPTGVVYELIRSGIAVYSIHTALDTAAGGVNDGLADMLGLEDRRPLGDYVVDAAADRYKLVVFVPADSVDAVSKAVFAAGAGTIGNYRNCGFQAEGTGTFLPLRGSKPAVGRQGKLEKVGEVRFETIVPGPKLDCCIAAMREAHPYEVPAFDCLKLHDVGPGCGLGRIGRLSEPLVLEEIISRIRAHTEAKAVGIIGARKGLIRTAAVCAGTCGSILDSVIKAGADLYLTGELKHHQALAAQEAGLTCLCLSHTVSERFMLKKLAKQLRKTLNQVTIKVSRKDADPFTWKSI